MYRVCSKGIYQPLTAQSKQLRSPISWLFALWFVWIAIAQIPTQPEISRSGVDRSWQQALNVADAQNLVFGKDIAFTFGPLGYVLYPAPELTDSLPAFVFVWVLYALSLSGLLLIWRVPGNRVSVLVCWVVLSGAMLLPRHAYERMQVAFLGFAIAMIAALAVRSDVNSLYLAIAGVLAGLMPLFKINEGIAACAVFYALLAAWVLTTTKARKTVWRTLALLALAPPLAFVLGFAVVEEDVSSLWPFVTRSLQIAMGYSEAMALPGPRNEVIVAVSTMLLLWLVIPPLAGGFRDLAKGLAPAAVAGFFAFKSGMVRQDDVHTSLLLVKFAVAGLFVLVCVKTARGRWIVMAYVLATFCYGAFVYSEAYPIDLQVAVDRVELRNRSIPDTNWPGILENLSANWNFKATSARIADEHRDGLQGLRLDPAITSMVSGRTVDDVPNELDLVASNGLRWNPRPVIQSYSAYTRVLDQLNASHLASPRSADYVLMQWEAIDGRHPLLDDAASWRALFDHYDIALTRPKLLLLKRRDSPRYLEPRPAGSTTGEIAAAGDLGTEIAVPQFGSSEFTIMRAEIDKSFWGIVRGLLFRNSAMYLKVTFTSGKVAQWRTTRANLANGALIGQLAANLNQTLAYFGQPGEEPERVASIKFETPGPLEFSRVVRISWFALAPRTVEGQRP